MAKQIKVNWGDDEDTIQELNPTLTPKQMWNLFHATPRKCDVVGREREEGEVDDDEYNDCIKPTTPTNTLYKITYEIKYIPPPLLAPLRP
jgi:hypothetical protein